MSQPKYKFKWTNVDLRDYMQQRRFVAQQKRRDAEVLVKQAESIEMEMSELEMALVMVKDVDNED
jgi:chaperonin cofactor prefoldin